MIEVFDTAAARSALARRKLRCPDCGQALRPWGRARERTVRELGGALLTVRPDRARCTGCDVTHVVLDASLLPRRAYAAGLIGQALVAAARGRGHRLIARDLDVPARHRARLGPPGPPVCRPAAGSGRPGRRSTRP